MSANKAGWAVLGPGSIARTFLHALPASTGELVAVGSSDPARSATFAAEAAELGYADVTAGTYEEALADPRVTAVYVATVHTGHARLVLAALEAGKAVLCEKPLAVDHGTAMVLVDAARQAGVPLVEAFVYRFHPQTAALLELIRGGAIGEVRHIDASFAFRKPEREGRLFETATAGGGILDVGCYPVSLSVLLAQACGIPVEDAVAVAGTAHLGPTGVDEWAAGTLTFGGRLLAQVSCAVSVQLQTELRVFGSEGSIHVRHPFWPDRRVGITIARPGQAPEKVTADLPLGQFAGQVEHVSQLIAAGPAAAESPLMPWSDSRATMRILDAWRTAAGVVHP